MVRRPRQPDRARRPSTCEHRGRAGSGYGANARAVLLPRGAGAAGAAGGLVDGATAQDGLVMTLLRNEGLQPSSVVANCRMNREREIAGSNGYDRELRLHPVEFLRERAQRTDAARWLDLCCGSGRALIQAAEMLH